MTPCPFFLFLLLKLVIFKSCLKFGICIPREIVKCKEKKTEQAAEVLKFNWK